MTPHRSPRLFIVRHGQTTWNAAGRAQGQTEVPLDDVGREQARHVAEHLATVIDPHRPSELWSSDLGRCRETSAPIAERTALTPSFHPELRERTFGQWEGEPLADIRLRLEHLAQASAIPVAAQRPPGGESLEDVWKRIDPMVTALRAKLHEPTAPLSGASATTVRSVIIVSHGGLASILLARLLSGSLETARSFRFRNASVTEVEARPDGAFQLHRFDDIAHLR